MSETKFKTESAMRRERQRKLRAYPAMLEALKELLACTSSSCADFDRLQSARSVAEAAIKQAEGV